MPKGLTKTKHSKPSFFKAVFLLVQFVLIAIGSFPVWLVKSTIKIPIKLTRLKLARRSISFLRKTKIKKFIRFFHFRLSLVHLPSYKLKTPPKLFTLSGFSSRKRGRPRKNWFIPYYLNKLKLSLKRAVSTKIKIALAGIFAVFLLYLYTSFIFTAAYELPSPTRLVSTDKALTTEFFDRNGKLLYRLYEGRNRTMVPLSELPPYLIQATIAVEDKNFYSHPGVDPVAIIRAIISNFRDRQLEGGSTITQQLIKNSLLTPEKTYLRKIKEVILSLWAERIYTKDQILGMYLNEAPYGGPAWGVEAAAQTYFGKPAHDLSLAQAAYLAGLPASPTQFSPYGSNPELGKVRQKEVLRRMVDNKFLNQHQADVAYAEDLHLKPQISDIKAAHFVMYVKDLLSQKYGQRAVSQGGLKITTTLDLNLQEQVENIVSSEVDKLASLNVQNGAAMVTDPKTGQILAMVGSKDYHEPNFGSFNVALSLRQPGSSIKVATYATAFKAGYSPGNTILDAPVTFRDSVGNYSPVNYDSSFHGPVSIRTALGSSYNIPAVKMLATVGIPEMLNTSKDLGITTFTDPSRYGLSITLGGAEVKMIDMMTMYGALSQMGQKNIATPILKVTDSDGNVLEEYESHPTTAVSPEVAYLITNVLSDNSARTPAFGANSLLKIPGYTVAVKTGTTDSKRDNWAFGYTPDYTVGVWVGNNDNSPMDPRLTSGVTGAAPIWNKIMTGLLSGKADEAFIRPAGIIDASIDGRKDLAISNSVPKSLVRVFKKDNNQTVFSDPYSSYATPSGQANESYTLR